MDKDDTYDYLVDAVRQALADEAGGGQVRISRRMTQGNVEFMDSEGRLVKEVPAVTFFKKVTSVREKLRVLEQKINASAALGVEEKAEMQAQITRCYGSLTTFNFLFRDDAEVFKGSGGE